MIRNKLSGLLGEKLLRISKVAEGTGLSRTTLTNLYFRRAQGITFDVLDKLCKYLECDVDDLFEYVPEKEDAKGSFSEGLKNGVKD